VGSVWVRRDESIYTWRLQIQQMLSIVPRTKDTHGCSVGSPALSLAENTLPKSPGKFPPLMQTNGSFVIWPNRVENETLKLQTRQYS